MVGLPTPQALLREEGPTTSTPLHDLAIEVSGGPLASTLLLTDGRIVGRPPAFVDPQASRYTGWCLTRRVCEL